MKKVLLVKPYNRSDHIQPSLGLGWLATNIRNLCEVKIFDSIKEKANEEKILNFIDDYKPDIIGFQCYTFDIYNIKSILKKIKEKYNKKITTIIGGPHPTLAREECFNFFGDLLDYFFIGEAEIGLKKYLEGAKYDEIPGFAYRENNIFKINPQLFHQNIDDFGMPAWDLIHPETYPEAQHGAFFENFPIAPIMITRGCPFKCTFCAGNKISGSAVRFRSIQNVIQEMKMLYYDYGIREFHIVDDNFIINKNYAVELLKSFKNIGFKFSWATPNGVRMDSLNEEILSLMKETGLYLISLGIESGDDRILKFMKKSLTVKKIKEKINLIKKFDIDIAGFFILGFPTETKKEIFKTINLSLKLPLKRVNYFTFLPFPGTESYNYILQEKKIDKIDWQNFFFMNAAYVPDGMTRKQLKNYQRLAFFRFYFRWNIFLYNLFKIKNFRHFKFLVKRFINWIIKSK
ncbi:MAG TPA: radical SAM protein [bacterium]|nr:radical SAM protein [bacterium]HOL47307.1 radical SAM protein [bacterium]HPQ17644.1 radical SAM protein [bacterium]